MALAEFRLFLNNAAASDEQLDSVREIRVDQAIGMASEAELDIDLTLDDQGYWSAIEQDFIQPFARVRVEVKLGDGEFAPLIDGPIVAQRFELGAGPGESSLTVAVHDDSVLLSQEEKVELFENMEAHDIASRLFGDAGLTPEVESTSSSGSQYTRYVVQRGSAMQLLRELARRHGRFVYVKPGPTPGQSIGVFAAPQLTPGAAGELLLLGAERNIHQFSVQFDALRPFKAEAGGVQLSDKSILTSSVTAPDAQPLGDDDVHTVLAPTAVSLLARTREEQNDLDAATAAAVNLSAFAYTASAEIDANDYNTVLSPHQVISVAGAGGHLSGHYLISRVQHTLNEGSYKQTLTLKRNARAAGSNASGGLFGGVF